MDATLIRVLLLEDSQPDAYLVKVMLAEKGEGRFKLDHAASLDAAKQKLRQNDYDVLLLDLTLPTIQGLDTLQEVQVSAPEVPIVVLSGLANEELAVQAVHHGAQDYLVKGQGDGILLTRALRYAIERKRSELRLSYLAQYDHLTGLPNRVLFSDRLALALSRARRNASLCGLMFLDLDHFKDINDTLGHKAGDALLMAVANRLASCVREEDTIARLGGDEFTIILEDIKQKSDIAFIAQKIILAMDKPFMLQNRNLHVSTSIGISTYPACGETVDTLVKHADMALYSAKDRGRANYQFFEHRMNTLIAERMELISHLRHATENNEFVLYYQPQFDLQANKLVGLEALIRWQHPQRGTVLPNSFIHLMEDAGLINEVGEWVLRTACFQMKHWQKEGLTLPTVAVNISAKQFRQKDLVSSIANIIQEAGISTNEIQLELTESLLIDNDQTTIDAIHALKNIGIKLSIDDFGTGYSSLSYLRRFPVHTLKLDKSFIDDIGTDCISSALVTAVITLAHSLGLRVVAEGVEKESQMKFLFENHCDEVQGYFISMPMSFEECSHWLKLNDNTQYSPAYRAGPTTLN